MRIERRYTKEGQSPYADIAFRDRVGGLYCVCNRRYRTTKVWTAIARGNTCGSSGATPKRDNRHTRTSLSEIGAAAYIVCVTADTERPRFGQQLQGAIHADRAALHQRGTIAIRGHRFP